MTQSGGSGKTGKVFLASLDYINRGRLQTDDSKSYMVLYLWLRILFGNIPEGVPRFCKPYDWYPPPCIRPRCIQQEE